MPYAIEYFFDESSNHLLSDVCSKAATFYGSDYFSRNNVTPHIALVTSLDNPSNVFHKLPINKFTFDIKKIGFFSNGATVILTSEKDDSFIDHHLTSFNILIKNKIQVDDYYFPKLWQPHISIAQECSKNLEKEFQFKPFKVTTEALTLIKYPPSEIVLQARPS